MLHKIGGNNQCPVCEHYLPDHYGVWQVIDKDNKIHFARVALCGESVYDSASITGCMCTYMEDYLNNVVQYLSTF